MPARPTQPTGKYKAGRGGFLAANPFGSPLTRGFFYREKMRAIHSIAPERPFSRILEVGGGPSGLTALLYPHARIITIDIDSTHGRARGNRDKRVRFACGDAAHLPFRNVSFDAVTLFDVLEHVPRHQDAILEVLRVLRPNGFLLVSAPNAGWRFPYYGFMKSICPSDAEIMAEWGHVRRGYSLEELKSLIKLPCMGFANYINPLTVISHDMAFSKLPRFQRNILCTIISPVTWLGYLLHKSRAPGLETVSVWHNQSICR